MKEKTIEELKIVSEKLKKKFDGKIKKVFLFGSFARGDFDTYSDIDLMIVVSDDSIEDDVRRLVYSFIPKLGHLLSVKIVNEDTFRRMRKMRYSLTLSIEREGILLG